MSVAVRAEVGPATPGAAKPTGTVKLADGPTALGTFVLNGGTVVFQTTKLARGTHKLTMTYNGDVNYLPGTAGVALTVV